MHFLSHKMGKSYDDFLSHHSTLSEEVKILSKNVRDQIEHLKIKLDEHKTTPIPAELELIKQNIRELKEEAGKTMTSHQDFTQLLDKIQKNTQEVKKLSKKVQTSELEIHLLKERMTQKDIELKRLKEINTHLFQVVDELSKVELEMLNATRKK